MKLYLSSYRLGNSPEKLIKLFGADKKVAVISNAMDFAYDLEMPFKMLRDGEAIVMNFNEN